MSKPGHARAVRPVKMKLMLQVDAERCIGCLACEVACAVEHSASRSMPEIVFEEPRPMPRIRVLRARGVPVPVTCQHCANAPCVASCPTGAMHYEEGGIVAVREADCIGCGMCVNACHLGHPYLHPETGLVVKCDMCIDRVRAGRQPACVEACPMGVLLFGTPVEIMKTRRGRKPPTPDQVSLLLILQDVPQPPHTPR
ncbi:MAG: 4Fe-4S dicluster domain-containing protein [Crenarchaeota archaeon]|nr:4Fe-4S dicluster domain-containing protein [Thermoproteota archaeon]